MKSIFLFTLILSSPALANIYVRHPTMNAEVFYETVHRHQGISLSQWMVNRDLSRSDTANLFSLGPSFVKGDVSLTQFLDHVEKDKELFLPDTEWRQALVDILLKKMELDGRESDVLWDQVCYFFYLDEHIQERWPQFFRRCPQKYLMTLTKPLPLKESQIWVDGIEWKNKITFYQRKNPALLKISLRIYSDAQTFKKFSAENLSLSDFSARALVEGECHHLSVDTPLQEQVPLAELFVISTPECIDPVFKELNQPAKSFWKEKRTWFWIAGILAVGLAAHELKDKELIFEW